MRPSHFFASLLERPLRVRETAITPRDAIVVLGSTLLPSGALTDVLAERVTAAAHLFRAGAAPTIVVTGGQLPGTPRPEADAMADALRDQGVPASAIFVERASRNTYENARLSAALLPAGARVWLITQPFHARRAARCFRAFGFDVATHHIADSIQYTQRRRALKWLVREYASWANHLIRR
jgi:uncharacterized SAM-binding protein YcdF (DUF218 family)